jgi:hypothetical protein
MLMKQINEKCDNVDSAVENDEIRKECYFCNFFLSETEIQGLLYPAEASLGYLRGVSPCCWPQRSLKVRLLVKRTCLLNLCTQLWTEYIIPHISSRINCNRISEGFTV